MANQVLMPPEEVEQQPDELVRVSPPDHLAFEVTNEPSIWNSLVENVRDVFAPKKLPPLELTSTPIDVPDRMAVKRNPYAIGAGFVINGLLLLILILVALHHVIIKAVAPTVEESTDVGIFKPIAPSKIGGGGGGGGDRSPIPPPRGKLPEIAKQQITPPTVTPMVQPKLPVAPTVVADMKLPQVPAPVLGVQTGPAIASVSNGQGSGGGIGSGNGGGVGSGAGAGIGAGSGGGSGGGPYRPGVNGVSRPELVYSTDPEFSDEARKARYQGSVLVGIILGADGIPKNLHIVRALGMGLDEKALESVKLWRFKPAMKDGKAVPVEMTVEVDFHIY
jgi:TonB family protein